LDYSSNPVAISLSDSQIRIIFNSRDVENRSSIYSIDFFPEKLEPDYDSVSLQHTYGEESSYFSHGISVGQLFSLDGQRRLSVMGWKNYRDKHWEGRVGSISINENGDLMQLDPEPWMDLDSEDPISLSYPAIYTFNNSTKIWYGSTISWDTGNGEMLHILKEATISEDGQIIKSNIEIPHILGSAQAFSRPAIVAIEKSHLMAYSYRGDGTKYRIGFILLEDFSSASHLGGISPLLTSISEWESDMVEYPSFFRFKNQLFMLYNGNSFGKTGVGIVNVRIDIT
jgi:hypothetical protein